MSGTPLVLVGAYPLITAGRPLTPTKITLTVY